MNNYHDENALTEIPLELAELREAEALAIEGAGKFLAGRDLISIALHQISTRKLYLAEVDDNGLPMFKTFEAYWPHIKQRMGGISRSQAFNLLGDAKIAIGPTFNLDYETYVRLGGSAAFEAVKEVAEINQRTGEILGLKEGYEVSEGESVSSFIIDHLREYAPNGVEELSLNIAERKEVLKDALKSGVSVEIKWWLVEIVTPEGTRYRTKYEKMIFEGDEVTEQLDGFIDDPNVPDDILDAYKKRLPVVGLYVFE